MKTIVDLLHQPITHALGWTLLHFLWQGAALGALLGAALGVWRRTSANTRYIAACVTLLCMALAPTITFCQLTERPLPRASMSTVVAPAIGDTVSVGRAAEAPMTSATAPLNVETLQSRMERFSRQLEIALPWLVAAWLAVVLVLSARLFAGWLCVGRLKKGVAESLDELWKEKLDTLIRQLKITRPVRLFKSVLVEVPTVIGWLRPVILLPAGVLTNLSPAQLEAILAHELAHIRRHDYLVNLLQKIVETFLFYHPAVWWVSRQIEQEREHCCDDLTVAVCGDRIAYARALAALEGLRGGPGQLSLAASGGPLLQRIRRLLGVPAKASPSGWWLAGTITLLAIAGFLVAGRHDTVADETRPIPSSYSLLYGRLDVNETARIVVKLQELNIPYRVRGEGTSIYVPARKIHTTRMELAKNGMPRNPRVGVEVQPSAIPQISSVEGLQSENVSISDVSGDAGRFLAKPADIGESQSANKNQVQTSDLEQDAKLLAELGKLDEADLKLKLAPSLRAGERTNSLKLAEVTGKTDQDEKNERTTNEGAAGPEKAWNVPLARTNFVYSGKGRQKIYQKLNSIILPEVLYDGVPLAEVVKHLSEEARKLDPEKHGINFIINSQIDLPEPGQASNVVELANGKPSSPLAAAEPVDLKKVLIRITPPLHNIRLADVIDVVSKTADKPLSYSVEDYAVVFTQRSAAPTELFTRTFKVTPTTFMENFREFQNDASVFTNFTEAVRMVFRKAGVDFPVHLVEPGAPSIEASPLPSGKALLGNPSTGIIFVRASLEELDVIEKAIQVLNSAPPQVRLEVKMVELSDSDAKALGFDWILGWQPARVTSGAPPPSSISTNTSDGQGAASRSTNPPAIATITSIMTDAQFQEVVRGLERRPDFQELIRERERGSNHPALTSSAAPVVTGTLTDAQFRVVIGALEQRPGTDVLSFPTVTTLSGRQARIEVTEKKTIVFGAGAQTNSTSGPGKTENHGGVLYETKQVSTGPSIDLIPNLAADGRSMLMTITPNLVEFLGYDDPGPFRVQAQSSTNAGVGTPLKAVLPLPRFRVRQVTASVSVPDGHTIVLGGGPSVDTVKMKDKVPVLGDIPLLGRFFRHESTGTIRKNLIIFVTPTIIDAAGNPVHPPAK